MILCSRDAHVLEVRQLLKARSFASASIIEIPRRYEHDFFKFETTDWIKKKFPGRDSDLSMKRNVGLILARMRGWQRIFFMDDDIRDLDATALAATSEAVAFGLSVGLDMATMLEVLNGASGQNSATSDKFPNHVLTGRYAAGFTNTLMTKDVRLYLSAVREQGGPSAIGAVTTSIWDQFATTEPGADFTRIFPFVEGS